MASMPDLSINACALARRARRSPSVIGTILDLTGCSARIDVGSLAPFAPDPAALEVLPNFAIGSTAAPSAEACRKRRRPGCMASSLSFMGCSVAVEEQADASLSRHTHAARFPFLSSRGKEPRPGTWQQAGPTASHAAQQGLGYACIGGSMGGRRMFVRSLAATTLLGFACACGCAAATESTADTGVPASGATAPGALLP